MTADHQAAGSGMEVVNVKTSGFSEEVLYWMVWRCQSTRMSMSKMSSTILLYGSALAVLIFVLKFFEYRFLVRDLSLEFYLGLVALLFTAGGVWTGIRLTHKRKLRGSDSFTLNEAAMAGLGISPREYEVLNLMAQGLSNQEIADKLFVSLNTIKTHSANLFLKLEVNRRTQAVRKARELRLIP